MFSRWVKVVEFLSSGHSLLPSAECEHQGWMGALLIKEDHANLTAFICLPKREHIWGTPETILNC